MESSRLILRWCPDKTPPSLTTPQNIFYQFDFFFCSELSQRCSRFPNSNWLTKAPNYWESVSKGGPSVQTLKTSLCCCQGLEIFHSEFDKACLHLWIYNDLTCKLDGLTNYSLTDKEGECSHGVRSRWCDFAGFCWQSLPKQLEIDRRRCHGVRVMGPRCRPASIVKNEKKITRQHLGAAADSSEMRGWFGVYPRLLLLPRERRGMTVNNYWRVECSRTKSLYSLIQWEFRCCISTGDGHGVQRGHRISLGHWK